MFHLNFRLIRHLLGDTHTTSLRSLRSKHHHSLGHGPCLQFWTSTDLELLVSRKCFRSFSVPRVRFPPNRRAASALQRIGSTGAKPLGTPLRGTNRHTRPGTGHSAEATDDELRSFGAPGDHVVELGEGCHLGVDGTTSDCGASIGVRRASGFSE